MAQYVDASVQAEVTEPDPDMDTVLTNVQKLSGSLGVFLLNLFKVPSRKEPGRSQKHAQMVSKFLQGRSTVNADDIVQLMYEHHDSVPKAARSTAARPASAVIRPDEKPMAWWRIKEWAIGTVTNIIDKEAEAMASKDGGFHLPKEAVNWEFIHNFSFGNVMSVVETKAPTIVKVLTAIAVSSKKQDEMAGGRQETGNSKLFAEHFSKPIPIGSGNNRRDPFVVSSASLCYAASRDSPMQIVSIACMMLLAARNQHFVAFQQIMGLFLFANTCAFAIYGVLNRAGISTSYSTVGKLLRRLTRSTQHTVQDIARSRAFLLIYDNINRMRRAWDPDLGQKDAVLSGTAATFVEIEDCDVEKALDPQILRDACAKGDRAKLNVDVLESRIDFVKLYSVFALHCIKFLADVVPSLAIHREFINEHFRTTLQSHRMKPGRKSKIHPLQTSGINEGTTGNQRNVIDDLGLRQLKLTAEQLQRLLLILGGGQTTVKKIHTLRRFLADCNHGYSRYNWVLPLIQLWHMGWADLERVLSTHWGPESGDAAGDISTFRAANVLLGRKVKDMKRPDYYPAQGLIFDNLKLEILDCWKYVTSFKDSFPTI